jgi:UDP-glucose 4-epimerase
VRLLICGSEGRLMSATIPFLVEAGHEVIGVDTCQKWGEQSKSRPYHFVQGDCSDPAVIRPLLRGVEGVIQAAATLFGVIGFHRRCADVLSNDVAVQAIVLREAVAAGVSRYVFTSSSMVYELCEQEPFDEWSVETLPAPKTDYGLSKYAGERLCLAFARQYSLPYTIWRPFNVIDPVEDAAQDMGVSHVFADLIHRLIVQQQNPVEILGDGLQVRSFVHIREVGEAIARFSFDPRTRDQVYNLGRAEPVTMRELAERIYRIACERNLIRHPGTLAFKPVPVPQTDVRRRVGSFLRAERDLDWKSQITLDQALHECLNSLGMHAHTERASRESIRSR